MGRRTFLDLADEDAEEATDVVPGADAAEEPDERSAPAEEKAARRCLCAFAARAAAIARTDADTKMAEVVKAVRRLLEEGHSPIVFCRFIPTAGYVAEHLRARLGVKGVEVAAVTGELPRDEREAEVARLAAFSP